MKRTIREIILGKRLEISGKEDPAVLAIKLEFGGDPNMITNSKTPLYRAAAMKTARNIRLLLGYGAGIIISGKTATSIIDIKCTNFGTTALMTACYNGKKEIVRILLACGANINARDNFDRTVLMWSVLGNQTEIVALLLRYRVNIDEQNDQGETALISACYNGRLEIARLLLQAGANPNLEINSGENALAIAGTRNRSEIVALLRQYGAIATRIDQMLGID